MREYLLIISKMTWRKAINMTVRYTGILLSRLLRRYVNIGMPWSYSIEPCDVCNLRCRECVSGLGRISRRRGYIGMGDYTRAVDSIAPYAANLFLYFQGEPTLHRDFCDMVRYAHDKGIHTATSTNGHFLDAGLCERIVRSGLGKMIVSLDGYNQDTYGAYRTGGDFQRVMDGIAELARAKKRLRSHTPIIEVQTLVTKANEKGLQSIRKMAMEAGADCHYLKTMQIENMEDFDLLKTSIDKYSRYDGQNRLKNPVGFCQRIINSAVITIDMDVLPCCYDKDASLRLGNLRDTGLREIIKSPRADNIINNIEYQRNSRPKICDNCGG